MSRALFDLFRVIPAGAGVLWVGVLMGTELNQGFGGVVALFGLLALWTLAYCGLSFVVGLTTGNAQAPLALLPLGIPLQFLSTQYFPKALLPGWVQACSNWNPFNYMADASRVLTTGPFSMKPLLQAIAYSLLLLVITLAASLFAFSRLIYSGESR